MVSQPENIPMSTGAFRANSLGILCVSEYQKKRVERMKLPETSRRVIA